MIVYYTYLHVINALSVRVLGLQVEFSEGEGHSLALRLPEHVPTVHVVPVVAIDEREVHSSGGLFNHSPAHYKTIQRLKQCIARRRNRGRLERGKPPPPFFFTEIDML